MRRLVLLLALLAFVVAGCGGEKDVSPTAATVEGTLPETTGGGGAAEGDPAAGKNVFASAGCVSCHTLKDAGASGTVGPNLDESKPPAELVVERVSNGSGAMPSFKGQLSDQEIADVAAYVVQATSG